MLKRRVKLLICFFISFLILISSNSVFASNQSANQYDLSADLEEWTFHGRRAHSGIEIFSQGASLYVAQLKRGSVEKTWVKPANSFTTFQLDKVSDVFQDGTNERSYEYAINFFHKKDQVNTLIKGSVLTKDVANKKIKLKAKVYQIANSTVSLNLPSGLALQAGTNLQATIKTKNIDDASIKKETTFTLPIDGKETILRDDWGDQKLLNPEEDLSYLDNDYVNSVALVGEEAGRKISLNLNDGSREDFIVSVSGDYVRGIKVNLSKATDPNPPTPPTPPTPPQPPTPPIPHIPNRGGLIVRPYIERRSDSVKMEEGIHYIYIRGYEDKTIRPEGRVSRAEAVTMILRLAGKDLSNKKKLDFVDTPSGWYNGALNKAVELNMLLADGKKLRPNAPMTRGEFAYALSILDTKNDAKSPYPDIRGHKFEDAINQEYGNGRIDGYLDGTFKPDDYLSRAEAAKLLNHYAKRKVSESGLRLVKDKVKVFPDIDASHWAYYEIVEAGHTHRYRRPLNSLDETWIEILE